MRVASFTLLLPLASAIGAVAACSEQFPAEPPQTTDVALNGGLEASPPAIIAPNERANASSSSVAFDALRGAVWTANGDIGTVSYVDPVHRKTLQEIPLGQDIRSIAVSPDDVWVAAVDRAGASIVLLDAATRVVRRRIQVGPHPRACVWDAANPRWLYVVEEDAGVLDIVDRTAGEVIETIAVGRLPSGIAVSRTAREVYVAHRIDADVTIVDLHLRKVAADVPLADEPFTGAAIPNGKPLGFESLAVTADGSSAWLPHELLGRTHPFVFNETVFPAVSVVNLTARIEQQTDPNSPDTDGRKNLFAAISISGDDGQPDVFSQPCAVAMHPRGQTAWALMCGSQDLVAFGVGQGVATSAIRNLPCDHPSGMTLDATGARIFVVCDQSKQLLTFDTAGGNPIGQTTLYGTPIDVAVDTLKMTNPDLRAGLTLFFQANSSKGALATTGNNWMSCAACHLDGFGSNNLRLFEALLPPPDPASDAEVGHVGLADDFSTAVQFGRSSFAPHDLVVALLDQGGLSSDRMGHNGQVDPNAPPAQAVEMATDLAAVVAQDIPSQPTWLQNTGGAPDANYDAAWCGGCHAAEYAAWKASVHSQSAVDPMVVYAVGVESRVTGPQIQRLCAGCHEPVSMRSGDSTFSGSKTAGGVTCLGCHDVTALTQAGGNADLQATSHDWTQDHKARATASLALLRRPEFCGGCHQQFVPGTGLVSISTLSEHLASPYAPNTRCVDCHMKPISGGGHDHHFPGGNVYMGQRLGDATLLQAQTYNLQHAAQLEARNVEGGVLVTVRNAGAGHWFPTGVTDIREPWVELQPKDANGDVLAHIGGPDGSTLLLPPDAARLGIDLAGADGTVLLQHEISLATRIPFDARVPSGEAQTFFVPVPALPSGTVSVDAVLEYRNVRTTFYQAATGTAGSAAPETEMARTAVTP